MAVKALELRVGEVWVVVCCAVGRVGVRPRGVQGGVAASCEVGVEALWSLEGEVVSVGVVGRGEAGDSGRRNGWERGEPKESGEGL